MLVEWAETSLTEEGPVIEEFWSKMRCRKVNRSSKILPFYLYINLYIVYDIYVAGVTTSGYWLGLWAMGHSRCM